MSSTLNKKMKNPNWWIALLKGILLLVFGVWLITSPSESLKTLSLFFGLLIIIGGILEVWFAIKNREIHKNWGWALTSGILDLILGAFCQSTLLTFAYYFCGKCLVDIPGHFKHSVCAFTEKQ